MKNILENKFWFAVRSFAVVLIFGVAVATSQNEPEEPTAFQPANRTELDNAIDMYDPENEEILAAYGDINSWDVTLVTDMSFLFHNSSFNYDISNWNVSSVTAMNDMFHGNSSFNQDLSSWDVSSVTNLHQMFHIAESFDQDLSSWDVSNVIVMSQMFWRASSFNSDISSWNVSNVTQMQALFSDASSFNQDLSGWDVSSASNMSYMFFNTPFNHDISSWDISNVTNFSFMFDNNALSDENKCAIDAAFSGPYWPYNWDQEIDCSQFIEPAIVGRWLLAPFAGALSYGPADGSEVWWAISDGEVDNRPCLFDDVYVFESDGTFKNELGDTTWLESWQGVEEGCAAPIAPHDGQNPGAWSFTSSYEDTIRIEGVGSFLGIAKATNGLELPSPDQAPDYVEYEIVSLVKDSAMVVNVHVGGGVWTFSFVSEDLEVEDVDTHSDVTFAVNMSNETVDPTGVYIAGGAIFGNAGLPLEDNGNGIWTVTASLPIGERVYYKFRNRASADGGDWGGFEPEQGLIDGGCADGQYNDRFVDVGPEGAVLDPVCYGLCGDCPSTINITFQVGMPPEAVISEQGVFVGGGTYFGGHNDNQMEHVGDNVYVATISVPANSGSHYTYVNGDWWDDKEDIGAQGCSDPFTNNDRFIEWGEEDIIVNNCFGYCGDGNGLCFDLPEPSFVAVDFSVDMSEFSWDSGVPADSVWVTGTFDGWSGKGYPLFDYEENGVYRTTVDFHLNGGLVEYKYTVDGWGSPESGAALGEDCDFYQENDDNSANYGFHINDSDIELPTFVFGQGCDTREEDNGDWICEITNCDNLHFVGLLAVEMFTDDMFTYEEVVTLVNDGVIGMGVNGMWPDGDSTDAIFLPQISSVEDSAFIFIAEYPFGVPAEDPVSYEWYLSFDGDIIGEGPFLFGGGDYSDCAYPHVTSEGDTIAMRYWDPMDYAEELAEIAVGENEVGSLWEFSYWGSCDFPFDDDGDGNDDHEGEISEVIDFYTYYDLESRSTTGEGNACDTHDGETYMYDMVWKIDNAPDTGTGSVYLTTPDCPTINSHWKAFELDWDDVSYETQEGGMMWCNSQDSAGECQPGAWGQDVVYVVMTEEHNVFKVELTDYYIDEGDVFFRYERLFPSDGPDLCGDDIELWGNCYASDIEVIDLYEMGLQGEIPPQIGEFSNLQVLRLDNNDLTGEIPGEIWNLVNLVHLEMDGNNLVGGLSSDIVNLQNLEILDIDNNNLSGELPQTIGLLSSLVELDVDYNMFSGAIPASIGQLPNANSLDLKGNLFTEVPQSICNFGNPDEQRFVQLDYNYICEPVECDVPNLSISYAQQNTADCGNQPGDGFAFIQFDNVNSMNKRRYGHGLASDGWNAFAVGGSDGNGMVSGVEEYDSYNGEWQIIGDTSATELRRYCDAEIVDGSLYVFGGVRDAEGYATGSPVVDVMDLSTGEVTKKESPWPVTYGASAVWNDEIYLWGGSHVEFDSLGNYDAPSSNRLYKYSPLNDEWTRLADYPESIGSLEGVAVDGHLYSFGGYNGATSDNIFRYNIETDMWDHLGQMSTAVSAHSVAYDSTMHTIIISGDYGNLEYTGIYDLNTMEFHVVPNADFAGRRHSASLFLNGALFTAGGAQPEGYNGNEDYKTLKNVQYGYIDYDYQPQNLVDVTFWLDAEDVPCGGNPWVSGTFNEWNPEGDTMYEMSYDSYWNEFSVDLFLEPGYYEYKFHCYDNGVDWTDEETVPAECGVPNSPDAVEYHRFINVPELNVDDWYEVPVVAWGECPDPEPCELVDCNNLAIVHIVEDSLISVWVDTLVSSGFISNPDSAYAFVMDGNMPMSVHNFLDNDSVDVYPAQVVDSDEGPFGNILVYLAEIPGGIPDTLFSYYWTYRLGEIGLWAGEYFEGECTYYNDAFGGETRYWDPADWEEEFFLLSINDEDTDITDTWNYDNWNSCDWYDYDDGSDDYVTFTKDNYADPSLEENQDRITDWLWITRGDQGWLYNAALENSHSAGSPTGTMWAMGTTESQSFNNYSTLKDVVDSEIGGFNNIAGMIMSMHVMETDEYYDVMFNSWTSGNNGGGFSYSRVNVEGPSIEEPVLTNYSIDVININSLFDGDTVGTLPMLEINDGLFFRAVFDMSSPGPYVGLATVYFDSNFNGVLDMDDQNILNENWNNDGNEVLPILDNGPLDQNPELGIYEQIAFAQAPGNENLMVQGATYFYVALDTSNTITSVQPVTPYSESTQRVSGHALMAHDSTEAAPRLMFSVYNSSNGELRMGITDLDGHYSIGVDMDEYSYGNIYYSNQGFGSNSRLRPLFYNDNYYEGYWTGSYYFNNVSPEGIYIPVTVLEYNTLVYGHMFNPMGETVADQWLEYQNSTMIYETSFNDWSYTSTDSNGYYQYWAMNGGESEISFHTEDGLDLEYDTTMYVFSDQYDDELGAYLFNHDIQLLPPPPGPPVNLIANGGFENWSEGWNVYPVEASNWVVDSAGTGIHSSPDATLDVYDGSHALKMYGGYHSDGFNWTDIYQSHIDYVDEGGVIHASAKMMSHPDDWIGTLDSSAHLGLNKAYVFISYWDENGYMIDSDYSNPFDGTFDAGQWHHIEVTGTVPNGTHHVNIGLSFNQNDWSNGSVYIDEVDSHVGLNFVVSGVIEGHIIGEMYDEDMQYWYMTDLANVPVEVYSETNYYVVHTDDNGYYSLEVPAGDFYYVSVPDMPGMYTYDYHHIYVEEYNSYGADIGYYAIVNQRFELTGRVVDTDGNPIVGAQVEITGVSDTNYWHSVYTNENGDFFEEVTYGVYDLKFYFYGHLNLYTYDVEVYDHTDVGQIEMQFISDFDGSVQGVITYVGQEEPDMPAYMYITNDYYQAYVNVDENGFFYADLIDGIYNVYANAPGYSSIWLHNAFEISGNNVVFDFNLYEEGYAGPPEIVDLHDIPNDQGRQMRTVWHSGMAGEWEYFTQFSIWRKVNGAPIDLWDYVETIPWHGESDPYAAVVPTLGDSSMHEAHMSTFIVTAHTEDVNYFRDSEPVSGYSVDNLHPGTPMNFMMSQDPGFVSLSWTRYDDEDFDYHNIYRREIASDEPAMVFTTVDSFYVDQDVSESGAYEYWITSVDMSGLESDPSNSVSAVLSSDETIGLPTEFALNQNYPNPFNPSTQIQYALPEEAMVTISIYDLMGRKIRTLVNGVQNAGYRTVMWNATNDMGRLVSAGVYIYSIKAGDFVQNRKMVLMK